MNLHFVQEWLNRRKCIFPFSSFNKDHWPLCNPGTICLPLPAHSSSDFFYILASGGGRARILGFASLRVYLLMDSARKTKEEEEEKAILPLLAPPLRRGKEEDGAISSSSQRRGRERCVSPLFSGWVSWLHPPPPLFFGRYCVSFRQMLRHASTGRFLLLFHFRHLFLCPIDLPPGRK